MSSVPIRTSLPMKQTKRNRMIGIHSDTSEATSKGNSVEK